MTAEAEYAAVPISVTVNGVKHEATVEPRALLVYFLREHLGLTGTHVGCDTSQCGACTVQLNGRAVKSCTILAVQANGTEITTIEGLAREGALHPVQEGFREKQSSEYLWKPHADAITYLIQSSGTVFDSANQVLSVALSRGLEEKANSLGATITKLKTALQKTATALQNAGNTQSG